ncbi:MAG: PEGA domain-containing protein, partial [Candidatus Atribacteria bacterium]|nr:PEGA domain-containing protein [Candidatus Atribacteria bacterium]
GYEPWQKTIRVSDRKSTFLSADLESTGQFGSIAIRCNKDIARIYIDDQFKRLTQKDKDITIDKITAGYHDIRITLNGHSDWSQRVEIEPNQRIRLTAELFELEKNGNKGTLEIISNVDHALIYLNGDYQGRTLANGRITLSDLLEGSYEIKITKEGYDDYISNISIYPNHIKSLSVILQMQQEDKVPEVLEDGGSIAVYCNEDGARIFMNGNYIANTSSVKATLIEELREGRYEITVIKEGYQIWQEEVYVSAEEKISIFADIFKSKK